MATAAPAAADAVTAAATKTRHIAQKREVLPMLQVNAKIDGMMCGMCEAHCKDAVRQAFPDATKISASASNGDLSFVLSENLPLPLLKHDLKAKLDSIGYKLISLTASEAAEEEKTKGGFFSRFHRK